MWPHFGHCIRSVRSSGGFSGSFGITHQHVEQKSFLLVFDYNYEQFSPMDSEPVLLAAIIFSDSAFRDPVTGKLTLAGVFQRFKSSKIPFTSPAFFATALVTNIRGKFKDLPVTMNIQDATGHIVATANGMVSTKVNVERTDVSEIAFPFQPTEFEIAGNYSAVILIDGEPIGNRTFNVTL
jgi:hypothetical protein